MAVQLNGNTARNMYVNGCGRSVDCILMKKNDGNVYGVPCGGIANHESVKHHSENIRKQQSYLVLGRSRKSPPLNWAGNVSFRIANEKHRIGELAVCCAFGARIKK